MATNLIKRNLEKMQGTTVIRVPSIVFTFIHDDSLTNQSVRNKNLKAKNVIGVDLSSCQPQIRIFMPVMSIIDILRSRTRCLSCLSTKYGFRTTASSPIVSIAVNLSFIVIGSNHMSSYLIKSYMLIEVVDCTSVNASFPLISFALLP